MKFCHINGAENPADILMKYLEPYKMAVITTPPLHWSGDLPKWPPVMKTLGTKMISGYGECQPPKLFDSFVATILVLFRSIPDKFVRYMFTFYFIC